MKLPAKTLGILVAASMFGLTACNDNNSSNSNTTNASSKSITVSPSLGKISVGRVVLKNAITRKAISDIKTIGADGTVTFSISNTDLADPIIAEVLPDASGKLVYADEAVTDKLVTINADANTPVMRAATTITANNSNIGVTVLTEAAFSYAQSLSAQFSKANLDTANQKLLAQLKLSKFSPSDAPALLSLNDLAPLINSKLSDSQRAYAAYLATLATEGKRLHADSPQPAYDMLQAFSKDFSDGVFDGKQGDASLTGYNSSFIQAWSNWTTTFYASLFKLKTAADLSAWITAFNAETPNIPTPTDPGNPGTGCSAGGVQTVFHTSQAGGPYSDGQKVCISASFTTLTLPSKSLTNPVKNDIISAPFAGYTFADSNLKYEVIFNNAKLYEINLLNGSNFIGQFTPE